MKIALAKLGNLPKCFSSLSINNSYCSSIFWKFGPLTMILTFEQACLHERPNNLLRNETSFFAQRLKRLSLLEWCSFELLSSWTMSFQCTVTLSNETTSNVKNNLRLHKICGC